MPLQRIRIATAVAASLALTVGGCLSRPIWSEQAELAIPKLSRSSKQPPVGRYAVLFVVDDSASMADKQEGLAEAVRKAKSVVLSCAGNEGEVAPIGGVCPDGYASKGYSLIMGALVTTTSLEGGGSVCLDSNQGGYPLNSPNDNDLAESIIDAGEDGCGFEAPLEAMYRFLADPEPPLSIEVAGEGTQKKTVAEGVAVDLLALRDEVIPPFSFLTIIILTDEDDCSVMDSGDAWKMGEATIPRGASVCADDPASPCCRPCDASEPGPPEGCEPLAEDPSCKEGVMLSSSEAPLNTRCWAQKKRFGKDYLFPVERYTEALTSPTIKNREGKNVENPLFKYGSTPDMVSVLLLTGVPWQLITKPESQEPGRSLEFLSSAELEESGVWSKILGDPARNIQPSDPHLVESIAPRPGLPLPGTSWDPIHGHEVVWPRKDSLQYSCVFELPEPEECTDSAGCTCDPRLESESPLCRQEDGSYREPQRFAGAFPPTRLGQFARSLGERAQVGSVCPKQLRDPKEPGYGYDDFVHQALMDRGRSFHQGCFTPSLPINEDGTAKCKLLEFHRDQEIDCGAIGRGAVDDEYRRPMLLGKDDHGTLCEIPRMPGDPSDPTSDYYRCAHELHPVLDGKGYCYIDQKLGLGSKELVVPCIESHKRFFRSIPAALGQPGTEVGLVCDYRK